MSLRNFQHRTNIDVLVRAFARLVREEPRARLVLAARAGETRAEVEALVAELGLGDVVRFHRVEPEDLPVLAASGDVVVSIADTDSSPSSLLEAMASGRAMVGGWCPRSMSGSSRATAPRWCRPRTRTPSSARCARCLTTRICGAATASATAASSRSGWPSPRPRWRALYRQLIASIPAHV